MPLHVVWFVLATKSFSLAVEEFWPYQENYFWSTQNKTNHAAGLKNWALKWCLLLSFPYCLRSRGPLERYGSELHFQIEKFRQDICVSDYYFPDQKDDAFPATTLCCTKSGQKGRSAAVVHPAEVVDQACRGLFPLGFLFCNVAYWIYYLHIATDDNEWCKR